MSTTAIAGEPGDGHTTTLVPSTPERLPAHDDDDRPTEWRATGRELPVFADPSGRRAWIVGGIGALLTGATALALVIVITAAVGFTHLPAPSVELGSGHRPGLPAATPMRRLAALDGTARRGLTLIVARRISGLSHRRSAVVEERASDVAAARTDRT